MKCAAAESLLSMFDVSHLFIYVHIYETILDSTLNLHKPLSFCIKILGKKLLAVITIQTKDTVGSLVS